MESEPSNAFIAFLLPDCGCDASSCLKLLSFPTMMDWALELWARIRTSSFSSLCQRILPQPQERRPRQTGWCQGVQEFKAVPRPHVFCLFQELCVRDSDSVLEEKIKVEKMVADCLTNCYQVCRSVSQTAHSPHLVVPPSSGQAYIQSLKQVEVPSRAEYLAEFLREWGLWYGWGNT